MTWNQVTTFGWSPPHVLHPFRLKQLPSCEFTLTNWGHELHNLVVNSKTNGETGKPDGVTNSFISTKGILENAITMSGLH